MTATSFSMVFVFSLIVNGIATLRSSSLFRKNFGADTTCNNDDDGDGNDGRLLDEERRKRSEIIVKHYYLPVYLLAVFSDWVKGPYGYELYSSGDFYNYSPHEIHLLCSVIPFVSSIVFGTLVCGPIADNGIDYYSRRSSGGRSRGRKQMALAFALVTAISNIAKHIRSFKASTVGSILEGISTSLLFTGFDSWLISSLAATTSVPTTPPTLTSQLSHTLATAEYTNNIVAINVGWIATLLAEATDFRPLLGTTDALESPNGDGDNALFYVGGVLNPFDLSTFALMLCAILIHMFWDENHGEEPEQEHEKTPNHKSGGKASDESTSTTTSKWWQRYRSSLADAFMTIIHSKEILFTGLICSLFESAMFIFVFTWANAIISRIDEQQEIPFGLVFSTFMFGCMTGTCIFTVLTDEFKIQNGTIGKCLLFGSTCAFLGMVFAASTIAIMIAFFMFEVSVGVYFPMIGTMKAEIVPEKHRTTIYNMYRMPFNIIMLLFLSWSDVPSSYLSLYPSLSFGICACMVGTACFLIMMLGDYQREPSRPSKQPGKILSDQALHHQKKLS